MKYIIFTLLLVLSACNLQSKRYEGVDLQTKNEHVSYKHKGSIKAVTHYNSANYFIYKGKPMGFHHDLLMEFSEHVGIPIEVVVDNDLENNFSSLNKGTIDLIATNLTITKERREKVDFTIPYSTVKQVLVQHVPENVVVRSQQNKNYDLVNNVVELAQKRVYVQKGSSFVARLKNLSDEIGDTIYIIEVDEEVEGLIDMVDRGEILYTICDEHIANANSYYYHNIDVSMPVSLDQNLAWAVRKNNTDLRDDLNNWLTDFKNTARYSVIYNKYFKSNFTQKLRTSDYYTMSTGKVSQFDMYIKEYAAEIDWDWKLLASMIYQESRFNPGVKSYAGAQGLMQLMPRTASRFGIDSTASPQQNIEAGIQLIKWLNKRFTGIEDPQERVKFILASYNAGYGHVSDARRLAEKNGRNPDIWDGNVDEYILAKADPEYYEQPEVKYGYCRGSEPYNYVKEIMERYLHYRNTGF